MRIPRSQFLFQVPIAAIESETPRDSLHRRHRRVAFLVCFHPSMLPNAHASPVEQMKRKLVEKALCEQLNQLSQRTESYP